MHFISRCKDLHIVLFRNKPDGEDTVDELRPPPKNKKRCFQCNSKLELAIRQIGKCRCGKSYSVSRKMVAVNLKIAAVKGEFTVFTAMLLL